MAEEEEEGVSLSAGALAALQSVLGPSAGAGEEAMLMALRQARVDDSSSDEDEAEAGAALGGFVDHAAYYRSLYPERFEDGAAQAIGGNGKAGASSVTQPVALLTMDDEYVQRLLVGALRQRPEWRVLTELPTGADADNVDVQLHWGEYEHIDWFSPGFARGDAVVSCYYNRKGLTRKAHLGHTLEKWFAKHRHDGRARLMPESLVLSVPIPADQDATAAHDQSQTSLLVGAALTKCGFPGFDDDNDNDHDHDPAGSPGNPRAHRPGSVWILKPSITNQAQGIALVRSRAQLERAVAASDAVARAGDFVLQRYVEPLLLRGRKFHLRVFVLLQGSLTAYVAPDFLAISSLEPYAGASLDESRAHLTNISHQHVLSEEDQHACMRRFAETAPDMVEAGLAKSLPEAEARIAQVTQRVMDMVAETVEAASAELTFQTKDHCFELFGLDFMLDPEWNVWLLEANAEPDLSKAGDRLQGVIDAVIRDTLAVVLADKRFAGATAASETPGVAGATAASETSGVAAAEASSSSSPGATHLEKPMAAEAAPPALLASPTSLRKVFERIGRAF